MRAKPNWQPAQPGVMLYMPVSHVSVDDAEHSLSQLSVQELRTRSVQNQLSQISNTVVPSCEDAAEVQIKTEPTEAHASGLSKTDPSQKLAGDIDEKMLFDVSLAARSTPGSSVNPDILSQLIEAAESNATDPGEPYIASATDHNTPLATEVFWNTCDDSDRTDFRESPSPSVRRTKTIDKNTAGAVSRHFKRQMQSSVSHPPVRRLNFGNSLKKEAAKKAKKSDSAQSLQDLANIENAPSHNWDGDERELLCILNRWYCGQDRAAEREIFAKVFNSITGLGILPRRVRAQFENHLRLYGAEAYPVFGRVFAVPFEDPEGRYTEIRALIEAEALSLGLALQRREFEAVVLSGTAKFARSPKTRKIYKSLVRRNSQEVVWQENRGMQHVYAEELLFPKITMSVAVNVPAEEDWEILTDVEETRAPIAYRRSTPEDESIERHMSAYIRPHLAFRVWDTTNRTKFVDGSFVAQTFVEWPRPFPAPIALEDPSEAGKILTVLHLSKLGDTPVFISTTNSLLQAITYAMSMQRPQIATINLNAPSLQGEHKVHHAADIFPWLKSQGLARWARYKGNGEYFIWAEIPNDAVLHTWDLESLISELDNDMECHGLFNFDVFKPDTRTTTIAAALREKHAMLNTATARALGKAARMFGMGQDNMTLEHLQDFVARLMDGWTITEPEKIDLHAMGSLATAFATAMGPHSSGYTLQQVMGTFIEGVEQGSRCIAHWSRSRSGGRRQRFRDA